MLKKVIEIAEKLCETDELELNEDTSIVSDMELSSMEFLAFISELEGVTGVHLKERELRNVDTLGELAELISEKLN